MGAVAAVLAGVARIIAVARGERGIGNDTDEKRQ